MAIEVGTAYLSILPSTSKLASGIKSELRGVEVMTASAGASSGRSFGSRFASGAGALIGGIVKGGLIAGITGASLLGGAGIKTAAELETSTLGFETMLGSAKKAKAFMKTIAATASSTPFELPGLTQSSQKLLAFGFQAKDVIPTLTTLGDAAAGLGAGQEGLDQIILSIGQIQAKGKVQSDELLQLTEAGIPALKILANQYGLTAAQMQEKVTDGTVTASKAIPALLKGIREGTKGAAGETAKFGGLMQKQSQSLTGLFSTLKDTVFVGMAKVVKPWLPLLKQGLTSAINALTPAFQSLAKNSRQFAKGLDSGAVQKWVSTVAKDLISKVKAAGPIIADFFRSFTKGLGDSNSSLPTFMDLATLGGSALGFLADHADLLAKSMPLLVAAFGAYKVAQLASNVASVAAVPTKIAEVVVNRQLVASNRALLASRAGLTSATVAQTGAENVGILTRARAVVGMIAQRVATIAISTATKAWAAGQWLLNAALTANPIGLAVVAIAALVAAVIYAWRNSETFRTVVLAVWGAIKTAIVAAVSFVVDFVKSHWKLLLAIITGPLGLIVFAVVKNWSKIKAVTSAAWNGIKAALSAAWGAIKGIVSAGIGAVKAYFAGISAVVGVVQNAFERVKSAISNKIDAAVNTVRALPGQITSAVGNLGTLLLDAGRKVIEGLIQGITEKVGALKDKLGSVTKMIPDWKGPAKTDRKLLIRNGHLIMEGLLQGLDEGTKKVKALLLKVTKDLPKGRITAVMKAVEDEYARGLKIADRLKKITAKISAAKDALAAAISLRDSFAADTVKAAKEWASALDFDSSKPIDTKALVQQMKDRLAAITAFRQNLATLLSMGLDPATYQALVEKGVEAGGALAAALVQDPEAVGAIGQLGAQISTAADGLGLDTSTHLFQAGVDSASSLLNGLQLDKNKLQHRADKIARQIAKAIKDALKLALSVEDLLPGGNGGGDGGGGNGGGHGGGGHKPKKPKGGKGGRWGVFDNGGILEPGALAFNASRKPEAVFNHRQFAQFADARRTPTEDLVQKVFNYYAAEGSSLGSEEDLFAAVSRARMNGW